MSEKIEPVKKKRLLPRVIAWVLLILFLLIALAVILITLSAPVQTHLIKSFLKNKNAQMEEVISIDKVSFHPIKGAVVNDLLVLDDHQDTLLYAVQFHSGLRDNILSLVKGKLSLSDVTLSETQINITTKEGESESNLMRCINNFGVNNNRNSNTDRSQPNKELAFTIDKVKINDLRLTQVNEATGLSVSSSTNIFLLEVDELDLPNKVIHVDRIEIEQPQFAYIQTPAPAQQEKSNQSSLTGNPGDDELTQEDATEHNGSDNWDINIDRFTMIDGLLKVKSTENIEYSNPNPHIFYNDFEVSRLSLEFDGLGTNIKDALALSQFSLKGEIEEDNKSYSITFDELDLDGEEGGVKDFSVSAGASRLVADAGLIYDEFSNFKRFKEKVFVDLDIKQSSLSFLDIAYFLPRLNSAPWVEKNINKTVKISGAIKGRVENFSTKEIHIDVSDEISFNGAIRVKDITDKDNAFLSIRTDRLSTSIQQLTRLIPGFNPPQDYYKLGNIVYDGSFTGFTYDFVANGKLQSSIGQAILDTRFDLKPGRANARYSGKIDLIDFDLRSWTGNNDFGKVSASSTIKDGKGLLIDYLKADLIASLSRFDYRGYTYSNINAQGNFNENQFNGEFNIEDDNIDFNFDGLVNIKNGVVTTKLSAFADKLDLRNLNLSEEELVIQGDFNLNIKGSNLEDFTGNADIRSVNIFYKEKVYHFDTIQVSNKFLENGDQELKLTSDYVNFKVDGVFNPANLAYHFTSTLAEKHPQWWTKLHLKQAKKRDNATTENFDFDLIVEDSEEFSDLINVGCFNIKNLNATGHIETGQTRWYLDTTFDQLSCDSLLFNDVEYSLSYLNGKGKTNLKITDWQSGSKTFPELLMTGDLDGDDISLDFSTADLLDSIGIVDLSIEGHPRGDDIYINVISNQLQMLGGDWNISKDNEIILGDEMIEVNSFSLDDGNRFVTVSDLKKKGLKVTLNDFDLDVINAPIDYENIYFRGAADISLLVDNVFNRGRFWAEVKMPNLYLNDEDYGEVYINAGTRDFEKMEGLVKIIRDEDNQRIETDFDFTRSTEKFNAYLQADNVDLSLFEFIIANGTSGTEGRLDVRATMSGVIDDFDLEGQALLRDGKSRIDYLGADIFFDDQSMRVTNNMVDLTGVELTDSEGNIATIQGGLRHTLLKDFEADATLSSDKFVGLNTTKEINPTYYGKVIGDMDIDFKGPFASIDITINGQTLAGSVLNIPVESSSTGYDESFITFIDKEDLIKSIIDTTYVANEDVVLESVMNIEMNVNVTPLAKVNLIFNERLNDIIEATGTGNLQVNSSKTGDFTIYGNYEIDEGEYLFTAWGFLAKPFQVKRGSYITWTGDPYNAELNIDAVLNNVRAPLQTFIQEYLPVTGAGGESEAEQVSRKRTDIDLELQLTGQLYSPEVSFDLSFPTVDPILRSYVESKLRTLRQNEAELNDQVASLLIFQSFIPSNNALGSSFFNATNLAYSGINTLSEFISSQISFQLSNLLQQAIVDNKYLSSIDIELGIANNSAIGDDGTFRTDLLPDEIGVNVRSTLKNDRWGIDIGGNYVRDNGFSFGEYTTGDFTVEYYITDDRRLKLRVYGQNDIDLVFGSFEREQRYGVGISYRKEFGSFNDFQQILDKSIKRVARDERRSQ